MDESTGASTTPGMTVFEPSAQRKNVIMDWSGGEYMRSRRA